MDSGATPLDRDLADELTLREAASATNVSIATLRSAIKAGELDAWIPRGKAPGATGPGLGYRINRAVLMRWLRGTPK